MVDSYRTLRKAVHTELKRKGSRFIAEAYPVEDAAAADAQIESVRAREHQATHHCTAYRVGPTGDTFRYDDDGEPSGTAGPPILQQIDARDLTNTLVVVTRYYGGTKLGTGGLIRAYGDAASGALDAAATKETVIRVPVAVTFQYDDTIPAEQVLRQFDTARLNESYTDVTHWVIGLRPSRVDDFVEAMTNALGGRATIVPAPEKPDTAD
ncbi:MAG: IMPACT family protein [Longimonas sp.]|uniref:IMPACT family protein n=1 Tax=Longimonas sp. TaxID=2039626 RepID=UPI00334BD293